MGVAGAAGAWGRGQADRWRAHGELALSEGWESLEGRAPLESARAVTSGRVLTIGEDCELDTEAGRCVPGVCRNGGTCADGPDGGFRCQCPAGGAFEGPRCEVAARSFPPSSFVMFRGLRQRFHLTLSLS